MLTEPLIIHKRTRDHCVGFADCKLLDLMPWPVRESFMVSTRPAWLLRIDRVECLGSPEGCEALVSQGPYCSLNKHMDPSASGVCLNLAPDCDAM